MNVKSVEKKENNVANVVVEITAEEFEAAVERAYRKNRGKIAVPGFRKGKVPRKIIEGMYGTSVFYEDALEDVSPSAVRMLMTETELKIVAQPYIIDVDFDDAKNAVVTYEVAIYPEVTLGEYKGVSAEREEVSVTDEDVDKEIETIRNRNARLESVERAAKLGDSVVIDYAGTIEGKPFNGGSAEGHTLELGSGSFIPGFEDQVVGMNVGDVRDIELTFPAEYYEEVAGKDVVFKVTVHEVKEKVLPELDDEFAKDVSEFDTFAEYRESVRGEVKERKQAGADSVFEERLVASVVENAKCDPPEAMVSERAQALINQYAEQLSAQGIGIDAYLNMMGMTPEAFMQSIQPVALNQLKTEMVLEKIAEVEEIVATTEDYEAECEKTAQHYGLSADDIKSYFDEEMLYKQIRLNKAREFIRVNGVAVAPKPVEETATEEKPKRKTTRKKAAPAEEVPAEEAVSEEKPKKKTTRKKAETVEEAPAEEAVSEEKPKKKTTRKKAAPAEEKTEDK